jgi:hypothetical protein
MKEFKIGIIVIINGIELVEEVFKVLEVALIGEDVGIDE